MRAVVQRVSRAKVTVGGEVTCEIGRGLLVLVAFEAAGGDDALYWYEYFVTKAMKTVKKVPTGRFGEMMDVELVNDGPVTIILDSEKT